MTVIVVATVVVAAPTFRGPRCGVANSVRDGGADRDAVFADFEATAPWSYPGFDSCTPPDFELPGVGETAAFEIDGACEAEDVRAHGLGNYVRRTLHVPEEVELEIHVGDSVGLRIVACQGDELSEQPAEEMLGDIRMEWKWGLHNGTLFKPATTQVVRFLPARTSSVWGFRWATASASCHGDFKPDNASRRTAKTVRTELEGLGYQSGGSEASAVVKPEITPSRPGCFS